ncbi:MAG TPA: S-methyl-5-thioribose-1-phosphate isomerase [Actinomycetes bacterium]
MDARRSELRSAVAWRDDHLEAIDQTLLPERVVLLELRTVAEVVDALRRLAIRGAPAIGVAAAFGVVLGLDERRPATGEEAAAALEEIAAELEAARPTAVNLAWAVRRVVAAARDAGDVAPAEGRPGPPAARDARDADPAALRRRALDEALRLLEEDRVACRRMAEFGRTELAGRRRLLTHCNTGRLATAGVGTALGVVYAIAESGAPVEVFASETRPLLQGARLTAWELLDAGIPVTLLAEGATAAAMAGGMVEAVLVGCDRVARNGDTANKIGTYGLSVLARSHGIPFYVVGPLSSFDPMAATGDQIVIEERSADELRRLAGVQVAPAGVAAWNPAFDVTPAALISGFITDAGVLRPPFEESILAALGGAAEAADTGRPPR